MEKWEQQKLEYERQQAESRFFLFCFFIFVDCRFAVVVVAAAVVGVVAAAVVGVAVVVVVAGLNFSAENCHCQNNQRAVCHCCNNSNCSLIV